MLTATLTPVLRIRSGLKAGKTYEIKGALSVGRHPSNHVSLADLTVSRRHAAVEVNGDGVFLTDLNSANGTFVNDKRVDGKLLILSGDKIRIGQTHFVFLDT